MTRTTFDAIVVGAGPAGSSAAMLLARAGWNVALVEKQRFPRRKVCGECIAASNLPLLDALGIGAEVDAHAGPTLREVVLMRGDRAVTAPLPVGVAPYRHGRALGRETLDTALLERARRIGVEVFQPWSVEAIDGVPGDWSLSVRAVGIDARAILRAPVAIDAHGSWEPLPSSRPARRAARRPSDLFAFKANFSDADLAAGRLAVLSLPGGYGGMVLAGDGITTVACCVRRDRVAACRARFPGRDAGEAIQAMLEAECGGVRAALASAVRDGPWLASGPIDPGIRSQRAEDPFRIGNAAGEAHPIIGEGMSMALQSAWLLCERLVDPARRDRIPDGAAQRAIGRGFALTWQRQFGRRHRLAAAFAQVAMHRGGSTMLMALAGLWPALLTLGARWGGKTRSAVDPEAPPWKASGDPATDRSIEAAWPLPSRHLPPGI